MMTFIEFCGWLVNTIGTLVMGAWLLGIDIIKHINSDWVSMKFTTAFCFMLSGLLIIFAYKAKTSQKNISPTVVSLLSFMIVFIMGHHAIAYVTAEPMVFSQLVHDAAVVKTVIPGMPAILTIMNFSLIAIWAQLSLLFDFKIGQHRYWIVTPIFMTSIIALIGYIVDYPLLYGYIPEKFSGMAFHTSLCFFLSSLALYRLSCKDCCFYGGSRQDYRQSNYPKTTDIED